MERRRVKPMPAWFTSENAPEMNEKFAAFILCALG